MSPSPSERGVQLWTGASTLYQAASFAVYLSCMCKSLEFPELQQKPASCKLLRRQAKLPRPVQQEDTHRAASCFSETAWWEALGAQGPCA